MSNNPRHFTRVRIAHTIKAPRSVVWAELRQLDRHVLWMKDAESIEFHSDQREGEGTTFRIILPLCTAPESVAEVTAEENISGPGTATTVLVIDDEADIASTAEEMLQSGNYKTVVRLNPVEGIETYKHEGSEIGLVLLDLTMPEMSGKEVVEALQAIEPAVKIIISSGYTEDEVAKRIGSLKVSAFIQKPYHLNALLSLVDNVLR